jgi:phage tail-like protein
MSYAYLNRDDRWPQWRWSGLDLGRDGALALGAVPLLATPAPQLSALPAPDGPAGVAVTAAGAVLYSDPGADLLWRIDPCDASIAPVPCCGGTGGLPTRLRQPRGLLVHPGRGLLLVADSGNHRIQLLDPATFALAGIWGQSDPTAAPRPGSAPGRLDTPYNLAADPRGDVYVIDFGNRRVQKFGAGGGVIPGFWQRAASAGMALPVAVAVRLDGTAAPLAAAAAGEGAVLATPLGSAARPAPAAPGTAFDSTAGARGDGWEVLILDGGASPQICVFTAAGGLRRRIPLPAATATAGAAGGPLALAAAGDRIYVGDNAGRELLVLDAAGTPLGEAAGFSGPVAALALADAECGCGETAGTQPPVSGGLWLHPGGGAVPLQLDRRGGRLRSGALWGGPFGAGAQPVLWHQVRCLADPLSSGAHLQLYFATGGGAASPPTPTAAAADPFATPAGAPPPPPGTPAWTPLPPDALQGLIRGNPAPSLWLGAHFTGEGQQSARLSQVRIDFDPETWSRHLPAIYREQTPDPELLERFLALFAGGFEDVEAEIRGLGRFLDPGGAPAAWLPWLAGWVGLELDETWTTAKQRQAIAGALAAAAHRGTVAGLEAALRFWAGVDAHVAEPILYSTWWALPAAVPTAGGAGAGTGESAGGGGLGCDTVLAPVGIEGAVVGTTAVLDGSFLIADGESPGAHLYAEVAHQFAVQVYERQVADPRRRAQVIATLEREKPAHTAYHLCVIAPRMRVGLQAVLGVDTVVAGPLPAQPLGGAAGLVLGGEPAGRIGEGDRVGIGTRLGAGAAGATSRAANRGQSGWKQASDTQRGSGPLTREEEPWP